jgi:hypothetical protein
VVKELTQNEFIAFGDFEVLKRIEMTSTGHLRRKIFPSVFPMELQSHCFPIQEMGSQQWGVF